MKRIYHPYWEWEEMELGMWSNVTPAESERLLVEAIAFTGDAEKYGSFMLRALDECPRSCEHNLTDEGINRKAYIGHLATALAIGCPEHITRMAWGHLSQEQQDQANRKAQEAVNVWIARHASAHRRVGEGVGAQGVFDWHSGRSADAA